MRLSRIFLPFVALSAFVVVGCGGNTSGPCDADTPCADGYVCEAQAGGDPHCALPVLVEGRVFDLSNDSGIQDAEIVALNVNGEAISDTVVSGTDGAYSLPVPTTRDADGNPVAGQAAKLRVSAAGYVTFATPPRQALPVGLDGGTEEKDAFVVNNAITDVGLDPLGVDATTLGTISGTTTAGALVVVVDANGTTLTAIADASGNFTVFNVAPGDAAVDAYIQGQNTEAKTVTVAADDVVDTGELVSTTDGLGTVSGQINFVAGGAAPTNVILVVESTYFEDSDKVMVGGETPPGLRADVTANSWTITDVPPGDYAVLAAYENDDNVRDPDQNQAGTDIWHITVTPGGTISAIDFKVTDAVPLGALGTAGPSGFDTFNALPIQIGWSTYSGANEGYVVRIYDTNGTQVHQVHLTGMQTMTYSWDGSYDGGGSIVEGGVYQVRIIAVAGVTVSATYPDGLKYLSTSEDLKGVFLYDTAAQL